MGDWYKLTGDTLKAKRVALKCYKRNMESRHVIQTKKQGSFEGYIEAIEKSVLWFEFAYSPLNDDPESYVPFAIQIDDVEAVMMAPFEAKGLLGRPASLFTLLPKISHPPPRLVREFDRPVGGSRGILSWLFKLVRR